jgi:hypothetical protein
VREHVLGELLDLPELWDLREQDQRVDAGVGIGGDLLGDLGPRSVVDQVLGLGPELAVVPQDVVRALG